MLLRLLLLALGCLGQSCTDTLLLQMIGHSCTWKAGWLLTGRFPITCLLPVGRTGAVRYRFFWGCIRLVTDWSLVSWHHVA